MNRSVCQSWFGRVRSNDVTFGSCGFVGSSATMYPASRRTRATADGLAGFRPVGGDAASNWLILQNETCTIGLFQGMFEKNSLTFNPGWDRAGSTLPEFDDVRDIQKALMAHGLELVTQADESSTGPADVCLMDPDGNPILIDQHVPRPGT